MAIRTSAAGTYLSRAASLPAADPISLSFWFYIGTDVNAVGAIWVLTNNTGTQFSRIKVDTDGTTLGVDTQNGATGGTNLSTSTWYHIGYSRSGAAHALYLNGVSDISRSDNNTLTTPFAMLMGSNSVSYVSARYHAIKIWTAALTQAELQSEMHTNRPQRFANLHLWSPTWEGSSERAKDYSGNGRNWTENGSLTDETPPPLSWGSSPIVLPAVAAAAGVVIPVFMNQYRQRVS